MKIIATCTLIMIFINCFNNVCALQLKGLQVTRVSDGNVVNLEQTIQSKNQKTLLVVGTYAADFNAIEYGQRLKYYLPQLKEKGISNFIMIMNSSPSAVTAFSKILKLQSEIELYSDRTGSVGKQLKVCRGYNPDDVDMNPYLKLFLMLWGLGAWATLPSVIGGYIGNPFSKQPWIEASLAEGQLAGRWPNNAIEIEDNNNTNNNINNEKMKPTIDNYKIKSNKFSELPYVGKWGRRPLELATLRLQNMIGISLNNWNILKPTDDELKAGVLTQLGACYVLETSSSNNNNNNNNGSSSNIRVKYEWKDEGICHVANFEDILKVL